MASWKFGKLKYGVLKTVTSGGTLTLVASSKQYQIFTGTSAHTMVLPDATTTNNGSGILFSVINSSTGAITINRNGGSLLTTLAAGASADVILVDHSSAAGTWRVATFGGTVVGGDGISSSAPAAKTSNYTVVTGDHGKVLNVDSFGGAITITLPAPSAGFVITIKDVNASSSVNAITIARNGSEKIDGGPSNMDLSSDNSSVTLISDGTDWFKCGNFFGAKLTPALGVFGGGNTGSDKTILDYVILTTLGNATDFGDLTVGRGRMGTGASSTRAVWGGGTDESVSYNVIDYVTFASLSNAVDFGDLSVTRANLSGASNATRALFFGGITPAQSNVIDYITIATTGNATDFGDLTTARSNSGACASTTRAVCSSGDAGGYTTVMDYVTIATTGNATNFGNNTLARELSAGCSNATRGLFGGGFSGSGQTNTIDYITIATTGNAIDFGDLTVARYGIAAAATPTRAVWAGGQSPLSNVIDYVTIDTTGNATDFGDLSAARVYLGGTSNVHGGI